MALKINIDIKNISKLGKVLIAVLPGLVITVLVVMLVIIPKNKEIKELEKKIAEQENEIAKAQVKADKLGQLTFENERLKKRLDNLKRQLPEEKEVSSFLKQVSDLCLRSGLKIILWKPEGKRDHKSGIVYEIPVRVELSGDYHSLGYFFSNVTNLNRIVNISDIRLTDPKPERGKAILRITFLATTFSAVPEEELEKKRGAKK